MLFSYSRPFLNSKLERGEGKLNYNNLSGKMAIVTGAVSYTHLDVYKRQGMRSNENEKSKCT